MILFYLIFGAMASAEKTDPGFCHQNFTNFRPNIGGRIEYRVSLDQAIEARRIRNGSRDELLDLTDRDPAEPYVHLEGSLVLSPRCYRIEGHDNRTVFEAYLRNVTIACLNQDAHAAHIDECRSSFGPLEAAFKPFWFSQSSYTTVSEFRTLPDETDQVRAFEYGIAQLFGITEGNCSSISAGSKKTVKVVHGDRGFHGADPRRQMRFHTLRVHRLTVRTEGAGVEGTFISSSSRAMYALDVHGNTKSGRVRDHHFVHTSLELQLKDSINPQQVAVESAMPPGSLDCSSDYFLDQSMSKNEETDTALEMIETEMSSDRSRRAHKTQNKIKHKAKHKTKHKLKRKLKHKSKQQSMQQEVAKEQVKMLKGIDITKAVTSMIDLLTRMSATMREGLEMVDGTITTVDTFREDLFSETGKIAEGISFIQNINSTMTDIDEKTQRFAKAVADPDSPEREELLLNIKLTGNQLVSLMTQQARFAVNYFANTVRRELDKLNAYPDVLIKNLKPMTDMVTKVLKALGPAISAAQSAGAALADAANADADSDSDSKPDSKPEFSLSMLPKSFITPITDSTAYKAIFGKDGKGGALGMIASLAQGDGEALPAQVAEFVLKAVRQVSELISKTIQEKINEYESQLRKRFNELLEKAVIGGLEKISDEISAVAKVVHQAKEGVSKILKKIEEIRDKLDKLAHEVIQHIRAAYAKANEYVQIVLGHIDGVVKLLSEGKTFTTKKEYRVGLMQGWSAVGKALATVSVGALPAPNVQSKVGVGIWYHASGPEREGPIVEISMAPSATLKKANNTLGEEEHTVEFDPPLDALVPMMSILGAEPIPMSTDPVKMFEAVLPSLQKRMMDALADTGFWYPILIDFIKDHILSVPFIQETLGGFKIGAPAGRLVIPGNETLRDTATAIVEADYAEFCTDAGEAVDKADEVALGLMEALKAPFAMLDRILSDLGRMWPALKSFLGVINNGFKMPNVKQAMCWVQDRVFTGLQKVCARVDSVVAIMGDNIETLLSLMDHDADQIDCKHVQIAVQKRVDYIAKKLDINGYGTIFEVCTYRPVLTDCTTSKPNGQDDSQTFMDAIFGAIKLLKGGDVTAMLKNAAKAGNLHWKDLQTELKDEEVKAQLSAAFEQLKTLLQESPLGVLFNELSKCKPVIETSASAIKTIMNDLQKQFRRLRALVSGGGANPDNMVTQLAGIFRDVGASARINAASILTAKETSRCESALTKIGGAGGGAALAVLNAAKRVGPMIKNPMYRVAEVAEYIAGALQCGAGLVLPIKGAATIIVELVQGEMFTPEIIKKAVTEVQALFVKPLQCVTKDIINPLKPLFAGASGDFKDNIEEAKKFAGALGRAVRNIRSLVQAGVDLYSNLKEMVTQVQKYMKAAKDNAPGAGLSAAMKATRAFKKGVEGFIEPLRELREVLELFSMDERTLLNILDPADQTLVGLSAGCDHILKTLVNPPPEEVSFLETEVRELVQQRHTQARQFSNRQRFLQRHQQPYQQPLQAGPGRFKASKEGNAKTSNNEKPKVQKKAKANSNNDKPKIQKAKDNNNNGKPEIPRDNNDKVEEHVEENALSKGSPPDIAELASEIKKLEEMASERKQFEDDADAKLDQLQESADTMQAKISIGGFERTSMSEEDKSEARMHSKSLQRSIEDQQQKLHCPASHVKMSEPMQKLLIEKDVDILAETITVPPAATYGVVIKINIFVHAVANIYIDALMCDCTCKPDMTVPCSELLRVGPTMNLHIIGVGSVSVELLILKIKATAAIQLGSLTARARLNIGRVANNDKDMCIKDLSSDKASFGGALTAQLDVAMLKGKFEAEVSVLGIPVWSPKLDWDGLKWRLGSFCFEPSKTAKKLRQLTPRICPSKSSSGFQPMELIIETANRDLPAHAAKKTCSVCTIAIISPSVLEMLGKSAGSSPGAMIKRGVSFLWTKTKEAVEGLGLKDKVQTRFRCQYPSVRALSLAGFTEVPDIVGLGQHFLLFVRANRDRLSDLLLDSSYGYFSEIIANNLKKDFGRIKRIFMEGDRVRFRSRSRAEVSWGFFKKLKNAFVSVGNKIKNFAMEAAAAITGVAKANPNGDGNDIKYLSTIFLCSEQVRVDGEHLVYNGTLFLRYRLDKNLFFKPEMKQANSSTEQMSAPFEDRFNLERDATEDVNGRFVVGFHFEISVHKFDGAVSPENMKRIYREGKGLETPEKWSQDKKDKGAWKGEKTGVVMRFALLKAPVLGEIADLRSKWRFMSCQHQATKGDASPPPEDAESDQESSTPNAASHANEKSVSDKPPSAASDVVQSEKESDKPPLDTHGKETDKPPLDTHEKSVSDKGASGDDGQTRFRGKEGNVFFPHKLIKKFSGIFGHGGRIREPRHERYDPKPIAQFANYESATRVFTAADASSEYLTFHYPLENDKKNILNVPFLYALPHSMNKFQVTYNAAGSPDVGDVSSGCNRPWLFHKMKLEDLYPDGREGIQLQENMCNRTKHLIMQGPREPGGESPRHWVHSYSEARVKAIQEFDSEPCADFGADWPRTRIEGPHHSIQQLALNTQQCFPCVKFVARYSRGEGTKAKNIRKDIWKCPVAGRREGLVIGASAQWLDTAKELPSFSDCAWNRNTKYDPIDDIPGEVRTRMSRKQCQARCRSVPECAYVSYWPKDNGCHLSSSKAKRVTEAGATSAPSNCECTWNSNTKYDPIDDIADQVRTEMSATQCQARCKSVPECAYFSHWPKDNGCHLSSSKAKPVKATGVTSAPRDCENNKGTKEHYTEGQYFRNFLYTMGERVEKALTEKYQVNAKDVTGLYLCGERVAQVVKLDSADGRAFHYSGLAFVTIESPDANEANEDLAEAADEHDRQLHKFMLNQEFTEEEMKHKPGADLKGKDSFLEATICDPNLVGVAARDVAQRILCETHYALAGVYHEVKISFDEMRAEKDPCRIKPVIHQSEYVDKNSTYSFFGWRLGKMAEEATHTVRSARECHICAFDKEVEIEGESTWQKIKKSKIGNFFRSKKHGQLSCNIDYTGTKNEEGHESRVAPLDLFPEHLANGTSAFRTLDMTVQMAIEQRAKQSTIGFWRTIHSAQITNTKNNIDWRERLSTVAVCDELGMENIPIPRGKRTKPEKIFPNLPSDTELYGATVCAKLGFETDCFQVAVPIEDITPMGAHEAREKSGEGQVDWQAHKSMKIWRGAGLTQEEKNPKMMAKKDTGHAFYFQVFLGSAIDHTEQDIQNCPSADDLQIPESSTQDEARCHSAEIGATEGYKCFDIDETNNKKKLRSRVDIDRTCDDTLPSWESLEYSQRFVTKTCVDTIAAGIKTRKPTAEELAAMKKEKEPPNCKCLTPSAGTAGHNQYSCTDGTKAYCSADQECYARLFRKGDWEAGCRDPRDVSSKNKNTKKQENIKCTCDTPGAGASGHNKYSCTDDTENYCAENEVCFAYKPFWPASKGCRAVTFPKPGMHGRVALVLKPNCKCLTPSTGTAGHNQYSCTDGKKGYCSADQECYARLFRKGDWEAGCRDPRDVPSKNP